MSRMFIVRSCTSLLLPCLGFALASCGSLPKKNAAKTIITARSQPLKGHGKVAPRFQGTEFLTFEELRSLARNPHPEGELKQKLNRFFSRPIISNEAWYSGVRPRLNQNETLGDFLRIATWNIEKSIHAHEAAEMLLSRAAFEKLIIPEYAPEGSPEREALLRERDRLITADVVLLQENDIGATRSGYRDAAREAAQALGMNYAFAPQQLEIDPVKLGLEPGRDSKGRLVKRTPDASRYKGVFGISVLSKHPIRSAQCVQLKSQPYDWYAGEKAKTDIMEDARRLASEVVFENETEREMKVGGRIFFRVDLDVPGLPNNTLTIIHNHLEIKATARGREEQLDEIFRYIRDIPHTVVMAGDFNSSSVDLSPTSTWRVLKRATADPQNWLGVGVNLAMQASTLINTGRALLNAGKNLHSPLAPHIPILFPNKKRRLFTNVRDFRFADGGRFDFRGDSERSINRSTATLANSNEKAIKGQTPTFSVRRPIGPIGRGRLDWIFVKAPPASQTLGKHSYRLAPHFGETLLGIGRKLKVKLSDHSPCVADIPLQEPPGIK